MINIEEQEKLLLDIAKKLKRKIIVYAVGGTAMMFHGFKSITKDIDLVFTSEEDRKEFRKAAEESGYKLINSNQVYGTKPNQPLMFARGEGLAERFDLFLKEIIHFIFSNKMIERAAATYEFNVNLILKIADLHDIILMKCATDRIKDKDDVKEIINRSKIDWEIIINEAINQRKLGRDRAVWDLATFIYDLTKLKVNIPAAVLKKLLKLVEKQIKAKEFLQKKTKTKIT